MIYGLYNKNTGYVRYVGRTEQRLKRRLLYHIAEAERRNYPKCKWIRKVGEKNVGIKLLEENPKNEDEAELWWMDYMEFLGFDLKNVIRSPTGCKVGDTKKIEITDELKSLMGTMTDKELGEKYGVGRVTIWKHRKRLGIDPYVEQKGFNKELPKECIEKLGEVSDNKLAEEFGYNRKTLKRRREKMGIDAYEKQKSATSEECINLLGTMPDRELAEKFGVSESTIHRRRKAREIPSYRSQK